MMKILLVISFVILTDRTKILLTTGWNTYENQTVKNVPLFNGSASCLFFSPETISERDWTKFTGVATVLAGSVRYETA